MPARHLIGPAAAALVLGLVACESTPSSPALEQPLELTRLAATAIPENPIEFDRPQRLVIRTQAEWQATWAALWRQNPGRPLPEVDFSRDMVLLAAAGAKPSGGHSIHIDAALVTRSGLRVTVRSVAPGNGCLVILVITRPVDIAIVRRHDGPVSFEEKAEVRNCF